MPDVYGTLRALLGGLSFVGLALPAQANSLKSIYIFQSGTDGAAPSASLLNVNGTLYGTTAHGGSSTNCDGGCGTVFSLNLTTGAETVLYSFQGGHDGSTPIATLINVGGTLFGTTYTGGTSGYGTIFAFNPAIGKERVVHTFLGVDDGQYPFAGLVNVGGTLYGTTQKGGGSGGYGTVFSVTKAGSEKIVYSFKGGHDGVRPMGSLLNVGGVLYSTTYAGGTGKGAFPGGDGTIFSLNLATGAEVVVHSFNDKDGAYPAAGLIFAGGRLYGTTYSGGTGAGTVFAFNPMNGKERVVHTFAGGSDGALPWAEGLINVGGTLYGTTSAGGNATSGTIGNGTIFSVKPSINAEAVLYAFQNGSDGEEPSTSLINVGGTLYGATDGGYNNTSVGRFGTVFSFSP